MKKADVNGKSNTCGKLINEHRRAKGWTQEQLAAKFHTTFGRDMSNSAVSKIERGIQSVTEFELWGFAYIFAVPMEKLCEPLPIVNPLWE